MGLCQCLNSVSVLRISLKGLQVMVVEQPFRFVQLYCFLLLTENWCLINSYTCTNTIISFSLVQVQSRVEMNIIEEPISLCVRAFSKRRLFLMNNNARQL